MAAQRAHPEAVQVPPGLVGGRSDVPVYAHMTVAKINTRGREDERDVLVGRLFTAFSKNGDMARVVVHDDLEKIMYQAVGTKVYVLYRLANSINEPDVMFAVNEKAAKTMHPASLDEFFDVVKRLVYHRPGGRELEVEEVPVARGKLQTMVRREGTKVSVVDRLVATFGSERAGGGGGGSRRREAAAVGRMSPAAAAALPAHAAGPGYGDAHGYYPAPHPHSAGVHLPPGYAEGGSVGRDHRDFSPAHPGGHVMSPAAPPGHASGGGSPPRDPQAQPQRPRSPGPLDHVFLSPLPTSAPRSGMCAAALITGGAGITAPTPTPAADTAHPYYDAVAVRGADSGGLFGDYDRRYGSGLSSHAAQLSQYGGGGPPPQQQPRLTPMCGPAAWVSMQGTTTTFGPSTPPPLSVRRAGDRTVAAQTPENRERIDHATWLEKSAAELRCRVERASMQRGMSPLRPAR